MNLADCPASKELYEQDLSQVRKIPVTEVWKGISISKKNIAWANQNLYHICISAWWFQIVFMFTPKIGEMIHFG